MNIYWFSAVAFTSGIETRPVDGARIRVYGPEKSIADAFKYRKKLGRDVALEALRTWRARRQSKMETLLEYSHICRVERIVRSYLEAMS